MLFTCSLMVPPIGIRGAGRRAGRRPRAQDRVHEIARLLPGAPPERQGLAALVGDLVATPRRAVARWGGLALLQPVVVPWPPPPVVWPPLCTEGAPRGTFCPTR